jgi:hypothetical protein
MRWHRSGTGRGRVVDVPAAPPRPPWISGRNQPTSSCQCDDPKFERHEFRHDLDGFMMGGGGARMATAAELAWPTDRPLTITDLARIPDDGRKYELWDGILMITPGPTLWHQELADRLCVQLNAELSSEWVARQEIMIEFGAVSRALQPDVVVLRSEIIGPAGVVPESRQHSRRHRGGEPEHQAVRPEHQTAVLRPGSGAGVRPDRGQQARHADGDRPSARRW